MYKPPLLVQRCNGTTAGLGYLEVVWIVCANLPLGRLASVASVASAVNPHWGENGSRPLFNLNHNYKNDLMLALFIFFHGQ